MYTFSCLQKLKGSDLIMDKAPNFHIVINMYSVSLSMVCKNMFHQNTVRICFTKNIRILFALYTKKLILILHFKRRTLNYLWCDVVFVQWDLLVHKSWNALHLLLTKYFVPFIDNFFFVWWICIRKKKPLNLS